MRAACSFSTAAKCSGVFSEVFPSVAFGFRKESLLANASIVLPRGTPFLLKNRVFLK